MHEASPLPLERELSRWRQHSVLLTALYVTLYVLLDSLTYVRPQLTPGITPWSPEAGLTLAFLLLCGPRWWPATAVAVMLSELLIHVSPAMSVTVVGASLWIAAGYGVLAWMLQRWSLSRAVTTARTFGRFAGACGLVTLCVALSYVGMFVIAGVVPPAEALHGIARYWLADLNGILMVTPLLVHVFDGARSTAVSKHQRREVLAQIASVLLTLIVIFYLPSADQLRFFYLLFVPVIWIALRWRASGAVLAVLAIQVCLVIAARTGMHTPRFIDLQFLMLTLALTALLLGAVVGERADAELQLRERSAALARAMRFAVAGELASALAHELNQPITAAVSYLQASEILASQEAAKGTRLQVTLAKAARETIRASEVLRRLRDFYRGGARTVGTIEVATVVSAVSSAFRDRLQRTNVSLAVEVDASAPNIEGDETQLEIVLHNLLANAVDAVAARPAAERQVHLLAMGDRDRLTLRVEDSGPGIASDILPKLFEPFVSSKVDGMGLGLAITRSLILARGGELTCERSIKLGGSAFVVHLPTRSSMDAPVA